MVKAARKAKQEFRTAADNLADAIIKGLQEKKAKDIVMLDLRSLNSSVADIFIVCNGDSSTQVEGLARSVEQIVEKDTGELPEHIEGKQQAHWILMDYISVVVHIFQPDQRAYYGIERLWADAHVREIAGN
jgi:ribosome-associated protein